MTSSISECHQFFLTDLWSEPTDTYKTMETVVERNRHRLSGEFNVEHYDVLIISNANDRTAATRYCNHLNKLSIKNEKGENIRTIKAALLRGKQFMHISNNIQCKFSEVVDRCTIVFLFVTENVLKSEEDIYLGQTSNSHMVKRGQGLGLFLPILCIQREINDDDPLWLKNIDSIRYEEKGDSTEHDENVQRLLFNFCAQLENRNKSLLERQMHEIKNIQRKDMEKSKIHSMTYSKRYFNKMKIVIILEGTGSFSLLKSIFSNK